MISGKNYYGVGEWLEFVEGEMDPAMEQDLACLMANSPADREIVRQLATTREFIKRTDEIALPEDGRYYDRLHENIMSKLNEEIGEQKFSAVTGAKAEAEAREELRQQWAVIVHRSRG